MNNTFITEGEYVMNEYEKKYFEIYGNNHERRIDLPGLSPQLISKRQELENIQIELQNFREDQEKWISNYEQKKNEIHQKSLKIETEEKLNSEYIKHMQNEINKIIDNKNNEIQLSKKYNKEFVDLNEKEKELKEKLKKLQENLILLKPSAKFFEELVEKSQSFENSDVILHRYDILTSIKNDGINKLKKLIRINSTSDGLLNFELEKEKNNQISLNNNLLNFFFELNELYKNHKYIQIISFKDIERITQKEEEYATTISSIENICDRVIYSQDKVGKIIGFLEKPKTIEGKLDLIEKRFTDLSEIINFENKKIDSPIKKKNNYTPRKIKIEKNSSNQSQSSSFLK